MSVNYKKVLYRIRAYASLMVLTTAVTPVRADSGMDSIFADLSTLYAGARPVIAIAGSIIFIVAIVMWFSTTDPKKAATARTWAVSVFIGVIVFMLAPWLLKGIAQTLGGGLIDHGESVLEEMVKPDIP